MSKSWERPLNKFAGKTATLAEVEPIVAGIASRADIRSTSVRETTYAGKPVIQVQVTETNNTPHQWYISRHV